MLCLDKYKQLITEKGRVKVRSFFWASPESAYASRGRAIPSQAFAVKNGKGLSGTVPLAGSQSIDM